MDDVARYLQYSSVQALKAGQGIAAELHALQLVGSLYAERLQEADGHGLEASLLQQSLQLLAQASATQQAKEARQQRIQAAAAKAGLPANYTLPPDAQVPALSAMAGSSSSWSELLSRGKQARQDMQQVSQHIAAAAAALAGSQQAGFSTGSASKGLSDPMDVDPGLEPSPPQHAAAAAAAAAAQPGKPTGTSAATAAKWGATAAAVAAAPQRVGTCSSVMPAAAAGADSGTGLRPVKRGLDQAQGDNPYHRHQVDLISSDSDEEYRPHRKQQQKQQQQPWHWKGSQQQPQQQQGHGKGAQGRGAAGGEPPDAPGGSSPGGFTDQLAKAPGFTSARTQLVVDLHKKGQHQQATALQTAAPRAGLSRGRGRGGAGGAVGGGRSGFVPPFVSKAVEAHTGQGAQGAGGGEEGPLSARTLQLLGVGEDGELPPELARHDPRLIEQVCNEVIDTSGGVSWEDIAGLHTAKTLVNEIVVWPMLNPNIFTGPRAPPKGLLLFGPPGTGKTLIGKAIASNVRASFFSISASSLTSKWIGEGEKMVKVLFAVAGCLQPSVIFIDEIDSILSARKSDGEHEASRRLKTEMLVQMEGCDPSSSQRRVLLIGATNRPEELDEAARRRMPKQLYIPLPCHEARRAMIERQLGSGAAVAAQLSSTDLDKIVAKTQGYSGSDMRNLIQEACQGPVRDAVARLGNRVAELSSEDLRPVLVRDFAAASKAQRASVTPAEIQRYEEYNERHGAKYAEGGNAEAAAEDDDW